MGHGSTEEEEAPVLGTKLWNSVDAVMAMNYAGKNCWHSTCPVASLARHLCNFVDEVAART